MHLPSGLAGVALGVVLFYLYLRFVAKKAVQEMLLLVAVWLIVLGYSSLFVGYNTVTGKTMTFKEALTGTP